MLKKKKRWYISNHYIDLPEIDLKTKIFRFFGVEYDNFVK